MDKFGRLVSLYRLLAGRHTALALTEMASRLECSPPTVKRAIHELRETLGAPVPYDRERGGYWLKDPVEIGAREVPGLWFTADELRALLICHHVLENLQPGFLGERLEPLREKIERLVGRKSADEKAITRRVRLFQPGRRGNCPRFPGIARATLDRQRLWITYAGRATGFLSRREISPQRLVLYRDNWYLDAWCHRREALRSFAVERILDIRVLSRPAREVNDPTLDAYFAKSYGIFSGPVRGTAVLRFSPHRARWVADETWHPAQRTAWLPDGRFEMRVPYGDPTELIMEILKHGPEVEVIEPHELRTQVAEILRQALEKNKTQ